MCRMILAIGSFSTKAVLNAARSMSEGVTADQDGPLKQHRNGWGAVWRDKKNGELSVYRDVRTISASLHESCLTEIETNFLAVHVRHATLAHTQGLAYTHPITREDMPVPWFLMHNGFLPTVYRELGLKRSFFDSGEYFDYIIPTEAYEIDKEAVTKKLERLSPKVYSANSILVNPQRAYVLQWFPEDSEFPVYYTMRMLQTRQATYISSESIPELAAANRWSSLKRGEIIEFILADKNEDNVNCSRNDVS